MGNHVPKEFWGSLTQRFEELEVRVDKLARWQRDYDSLDFSPSTNARRIDQLASQLRELTSEASKQTCDPSDTQLFGQPLNIVLMIGLAVMLCLVLMLRWNMGSKVRHFR